MGPKKLKLSSFRRRQTACGYILVGVSFLLLSLLTVKIFAPQVETDAASQTASQTVGPYSLSMANDSVATINITPTASQAVYTASNNLSVTNTCTSGATITMTVNSTTSNALTRSATNSDTLTKTIAATSGSSLVDNSWGYSKNNGTNYYAVPLKNATPATIYDASAAQTSALSVPVLFGVKTDNNLPSGNYTNTVVYTMTPKSGCLTYSITWDFDGGTAKSGATYPTSKGWGETVNLSQLTPTKSGYTFDGWTNGSSTFTGSETAANLNSGNAKTVTVKAKWKSNCNDGLSSVGSYKNFDYTGSVQTFNACAGRTYKLEVWGAQGGGVTAGAFKSIGGYGGYAYGRYVADNNKTLYITVGGTGTGLSRATPNKVAGGYNGGGATSSGDCVVSLTNVNATYVAHRGASGGGATDISLAYHAVSFNSTTGRYEKDYSDRLIVAGGGGGGNGKNLAESENGNVNGGKYGAGGGYIGANGTTDATGGTQISGGNSGFVYFVNDYPAFNTASQASLGVGGSWYSDETDTGGCRGGNAGGGGGYYGGGWGGRNSQDVGAGGSGFIGHTQLLSDKGMYMYNYNSSCSSSSVTATKTTCTTSVSSAATSNSAKSGNGYAKITYLGT